MNGRSLALRILLLASVAALGFLNGGDSGSCSDHDLAAFLRQDAIAPEVQVNLEPASQLWLNEALSHASSPFAACVTSAGDGQARLALAWGDLPTADQLSDCRAAGGIGILLFRPGAPATYTLDDIVLAANWSAAGLPLALRIDADGRIRRLILN